MNAEDGGLLCFSQHPPFFEHATLGGQLQEVLVALLELRIFGHVHFTGIVVQRVVGLGIVGVDPFRCAAGTEQ